MADEFELKLRVPSARREAVDRAVAGAAAAPRIGLAASYWDTPDQALAAARLALRVRREGRRRVQTLKGAGVDVLTRLEHEVEATGPTPDPALHDGTPAGARLRSVLATASGQALQCRFETAVMRRTRLVRGRAGTVELAFDSGRIVAGERAAPVCELEIELKQGSPRAVFDAARHWIKRHGLWIDVRSKAAIGVRLARGADVPEAVRAAPLHLQADTAPDAALRAMVRNALDQALGNAAELADGSGRPEHLHQLRVALRRLRSALREFGAFSDDVDPAWAGALAALFAPLGAQRDRDALAAGLGPALLAAGGPAFEAAGMPLRDDIAGLLRAPPFNLLVLDLLAFAHGVPKPAHDVAMALDRATARPLRRLHRRVAADAPGFATLDVAAQHRVRKRLKRLRYALEFGAALFPKRVLKRYLDVLRPAQEALGALNDLAVAHERLAEMDTGDAKVWFGLGWVAGRRDAVVAACEDALQNLAATRTPWPLKRAARR